jgi:hypothetical protein
MSVKHKARDLLGGVAAKRLSGERPGAVRAAAGATVAGGVTAAIAYRLLRSGEDET